MTRIALGMKSHSGWAALVAVGKEKGDWIVIDRRRIELAHEEWAKQPYHAAEGLKSEAARDLVERGVEAARRMAAREIEAAIARERERGHEVAACGVLVGEPMPDWTVHEILAVHFRMHKAEGELFRDALVRAAKACRLKLIAIPEKLLSTHAQRVVRTSENSLVTTIAQLGKPLGPPWGRDQKDAALAALVALEHRSR